MSFPIFVEAVNGQFEASLFGAPCIRVVKPNRAQAIGGLKVEIQQCAALSELLSIEIDTVGISSLAGKHGSDPTSREICDEAYEFRDAERTE